MVEAAAVSQPRLLWGKIDPEVRAMLPYTLDAIELLMDRRPDLVPPSSTGRRLVAWQNGDKRGDDGRACGALLMLGGCMIGLKTNTSVPVFALDGFSVRSVEGVCQNPPEDDFSFMILRERDSPHFSIVVESLLSRDGAEPLRSGFLGRERSFLCRGRSAMWDAGCLDDQEVANMLKATFRQRALGQAPAAMFGTLEANRKILLTRVYMSRRDAKEDWEELLPDYAGGVEPFPARGTGTR